MLFTGPEGDRARTEQTLRAHSWIVRLWAGIATFGVLSPLVHLHRDPGSAPLGVILGLVALGLAIPVGLLIWDHERGVHIRTDGILTVDAWGSTFVGWSEIADFHIGR